MSRSRATFTGFIAILLWALLALLTVGSEPVPPLLLNTMCFAIGGSCGLIWCLCSGGISILYQVPAKTYLFGTIGLFGYHALYFSALRLAPAAEAGLIAYLWPLLIVIFSGLLPGENLRTGHLFGGLLAFVGATLLITGGAEGFQLQYLPGYLLALLCALTWSGYSVLSRVLGQTPTASVTVFCLATAALSLPLHLMFETTRWPDTTVGWLSVAALGLGPVGLAFFVWDIGVKKGDIQFLGTASYAAPLLSTILLILVGGTPFSFSLAIATFLITGGAILAARASWRSKP